MSFFKINIILQNVILHIQYKMADFFLSPHMEDILNNTFYLIKENKQLNISAPDLLDNCHNVVIF